jgi:hypothetical protein
LVGIGAKQGLAGKDIGAFDGLRRSLVSRQDGGLFIHNVALPIIHLIDKPREDRRRDTAERLNKLSLLYAVIIFMGCPFLGVYLAVSWRCGAMIFVGWLPTIAATAWFLGWV